MTSDDREITRPGDVWVDEDGEHEVEAVTFRAVRFRGGPVVPLEGLAHMLDEGRVWRGERRVAP